MKNHIQEISITFHFHGILRFCLRKTENFGKHGFSYPTLLALKTKEMCVLFF